MFGCLTIKQINKYLRNKGLDVSKGANTQMKQTERLRSILLVGGLVVSQTALASSGVAAESAAETTKAAVVTAPEASPAPAPAPAPAPEAAPSADNFIKVYGILNTRVVASSGGVESYGQPNASAPTSAANSVIGNAQDRRRLSFQAAQTRIGFKINESDNLSGQLEFDFVDFKKATPTVASTPRVRLAKVQYKMGGGHALVMGQDWDVHAPVNPHGINLVGALFLAGNTGFIRQQVKYLYSADRFEFVAGVGIAGANIGSKDGPLELDSTPSVAAQGVYKFTAGRIGLSAIGAQLPFALGTPQERKALAYGTSIFSELNPTASTNIRVEVNYGQNTANLGLVTLASGNAANDNQELGGFISARQAITPRHAAYVQLATMRVLSAQHVLPSYAYPAAADAATLPAFSAAAPNGTGFGMLYNSVARLGYEFKPGKSLSLIAEGFYYQSRHKLQDIDMSRASATTRAIGVETGMLLSF